MKINFQPGISRYLSKGLILFLKRSINSGKTWHLSIFSNQIDTKVRHFIYSVTYDHFSIVHLFICFPLLNIFFLFSFADNFELNAQVPAAFPFSTCQRHFEATLLDFPHLCLQRDTIHCCNGLPKRKGKNIFFFNSRGDIHNWHIHWILKLIPKLHMNLACFWIFKTMVFCYQNCSDLLWEKIVLVIEKNFWNSRPRIYKFF